MEEGVVSTKPKGNKESEVFHRSLVSFYTIVWTHHTLRLTDCAIVL